MNRSLTQFLQITFAVLDIFLLNLIFVLMQLFFHNRISEDAYRFYLQYWIVINVSWLFVSWLGEVYAEKYILSFESFMRRTTGVYLIWVLIILFYLFFGREFQLSRIFILSMVISFGCGLLLNRFLYLGVRDYLKTKDALVKKVMIMGYNDVARKLATYLEEDGINTKVIGFAEDAENVQELTNYPILAEVNQTLEVSKQLNVNEIFSTITPEQNKYVYAIMKRAELECIRFRIVPDLSYFVSKPVHIDYLKDIPILSLRSEPLEDVGNRMKKRVFDVVISSLVIILILSWLIPLLGLLIFIESPGPIFFSQLRTGKDNKNFKCLKFRSMHINKDADSKSATKGDKRITRIGKFIRRTSLDEFPQFLNVFKGQMSLVGPRPHMVKHTEDYSRQVDQYMIRQFLKPGITGWAQVNGFRGEMTEHEHIVKRVEYDIWYLEHWSLWMDLKIMFLTVYNVFKGEEMAY